MQKQGLFQKYFTKYIWNTGFSRSSNLKSPEPWLFDALGGNKSTSGASVTYDSSLTFSAVWRCAKLLSELPAKLPINIYEKTANGKAIAVDHEAHYLMHNEPNGIITPFNLKCVTALSSIMRGNGLIAVIRDTRGRLLSLEPFPAQYTDIKYVDGRIVYHNKKDIWGNTVDRVFFHEDVINIANFSPNGVIGYSTIQKHRDTIGLGMSAQASAGRFYGNGAMLSGWLEVPGEIGKLTSPQIARLKETWSKEYGHPEANHKTALLEGGVKFHSVTMPYRDAQFLETRQYSVNQVGQIYGVPPQKLYDLTGAKYNNAQQLNLEFYIDTALAMLESWEQELNKKLFLSKEKGKYFAKFNFKALLRADSQTQAQLYKEMTQNGIYNRNEIRDFEDENPIPGGDIYTVQMQMMDLQKTKDNIPNSQSQSNGD